jgi:hypothetical protein
VEIAIAIFLFFSLLVGLAIFKLEQPTKSDPKKTGRGGDFHE